MEIADDRPRPVISSMTDPLFLSFQAVLAGRYSLEREIGRGGMGIVYLAHDVALHRQVAIKLLPPMFVADTTARERFLREARTAAGLAHPHVVPIHLVEQRDEWVYFVMGFVEGESLGQRIRRAGPLPVNEAVRIVREVAWALAYAHGRGVVHRDIKPDNVMLQHGTGRAVVTDFGIARDAHLETVSKEGEIIGSLHYLAPEQADPAATVDGRADQYALGVTAFQALTGRLPFDGVTAAALVAQHLSEPAPPVASMRPGLPAGVAAAVDRCLAKSPPARFPTTEALAEALNDALPASRPIPRSALEVRDAIGTTYNAGALSLLALWFIASVSPEVLPGVLGVLAAVVAIQVLALLRAVSGATRAGLSSRDIAESIQALESGEDENTRMTKNEMRELRAFFGGGAGRALLGAVGAVFTAFGIWAGRGSIPSWQNIPVSDLLFSVIGALLITGVGIAGLAGAMGRGPIRWLDPASWESSRRRSIRWFADNPFIRLLFRLARRSNHPAAPVAPAAQPTEVFLGRAAQELLDGLATPARKQLTGAADAIRKLEAAATAQRTRRDSLDRALAEIGNGGDPAKRESVSRELSAARTQAVDQLQSAMAALENLRLDLLRARSGVGKPGDLTGAIDAARRIGEQVSATLERR